MTKELFYGKLLRVIKGGREMPKNISTKKNNSAKNRPFSLKATNKTQKVNLQTVKIGNKRMRLSAKEIRDMKKAA